MEALWVLSSIAAGDESYGKALIDAEMLPYVVGLLGENADVDEQVCAGQREAKRRAVSDVAMEKC